MGRYVEVIFEKKIEVVMKKTQAGRNIIRDQDTHNFIEQIF
jgi:hypothetical protein